MKGCIKAEEKSKVAVDFQSNKCDETVHIGIIQARRYTRVVTQTLNVIKTREDLEQANATLIGKPTRNRQPDAEWIITNIGKRIVDKTKSSGLSWVREI